MRYHLTISLILLTLSLICMAHPAIAIESDYAYPSVTAWPLATHSENADGAKTNLLLGILHHAREGEKERYALRPGLADLVSDPATDSGHFSLLFGIAHSEYKEETFERHLFPIYWHGRKTDSRWFHLWPLYGESERDDGYRFWTTLFPFFSYSQGPEEGAWSAGYLWPLGASERTLEETSDRFLPLWWRHNSQGRSDGLIFPYLWLDHGESHTRSILPLWWWYSEPQKSAGLLFPYGWWEEEGTRRDLLFPLWYRQRTPQGRFSLLFPLYVGWQNERMQGSVVLPLWFALETPQRKVATLFPFYLDWRDPDDKGLTLGLPLYADFTGRASALRVVLPFYFRYENATFGSRLRYWFPFYARYERGGETQQYYLFPLYAHMEDAARDYRSYFFLWPLLHYESLPGESDSWIFPLFRRHRSELESDTMAGLLWWSGQSQESAYTLLLPFYGWWRDDEGSQRHILPFYSDIQQADGYRRRFFLGPLAMLTDDPARQREQLDVLWPLISFSRKGEVRHERLLPFWWHDEKPGESLSLGSLALLPPYYYKSENAKVSRFHLWPFYGRTLEENFREDAILWPLFRYGRSDDDSQSSWQALLAYGHKDGAERSFGLFPLWHHLRSPQRQLDLTLLTWSESEGESSVFSLLHLGQPEWSLFTLVREGERVHSHVIPLYGRTVNPAAETSRFWLLGPLYTYEREGEATEHALLWKLLYRRQGPVKSESGFLWRFIHARKDQESELFEFNPFYFRERQNDGSEDYIAWLGGLYATRETPQGVEHRLFWFLKW